MDNRDIRWEQRFNNFQKAFYKLKEAIEAQELNELTLSDRLFKADL
jgi:hypothetical protein